jgi:hypothetical protein
MEVDLSRESSVITLCEQMEPIFLDGLARLALFDRDFPDTAILYSIRATCSAVEFLCENPPILAFLKSIGSPEQSALSRSHFTLFMSSFFAGSAIAKAVVGAVRKRFLEG